MSTEENAEQVYRVVESRGTVEADDLALTSGVHGERLEEAVRSLEAAGRVERDTTDSGTAGYSFSSVKRR